MSEWKPISEAPKDGTEILVGGWCSDDLMHIGFDEQKTLHWWSREVYWTKKTPRHKQGFWAICDFDEEGHPVEFDNPFEDPTYWCQKPESPAAPHGFRAWPKDFTKEEQDAEILRREKEQKKLTRFYKKKNW